MINGSLPQLVKVCYIVIPVVESPNMLRILLPSNVKALIILSYSSSMFLKRNAFVCSPRMCNAETVPSSDQ